jgi:hypothetical protein
MARGDPAASRTSSRGGGGLAIFKAEMARKGYTLGFDFSSLKLVKTAAVIV